MSGADHQGRFAVPVSANSGVDTMPMVGRGRRSSAIGTEYVRTESIAPDSGVTLLDPDLPMSPRDSVLDALEHDLVCEGMTPSTVPASSRAVREAGFINPILRSATVPVQSEVGHSVGPTVVDMSFDDTDQDEKVAMAGNRFAVLSDHNSDRSKGGLRDARPYQRLQFVSQPLDAERASDHEWDADTDSIPGASGRCCGGCGRTHSRGDSSRNGTTRQGSGRGFCQFGCC